jgi:putative DNA primase/helicase
MSVEYYAPENEPWRAIIAEHNRKASGNASHGAEAHSMHTGARLDSATASTGAAAKPERKAQPKPELETTRASKFSVRAVRWFWPGRFALGKLGLVGGLPDKGKGLKSADIIARCTRGSEWPCNEGTAPLGSVIWFTAEDDIEDTVIPRLVAAGADLERVHIVGMAKNPDGAPRMFNLATDLELLRRKIAEVGDVVLVIIDPMSAYVGVGKLNTHQRPTFGECSRR